MKLDILPPDNWESLNDQVAGILSAPSDCATRVYRGLGHAVFEAVIGAAVFYSHKKHMGFIKGLCAGFDGVFTHLYKDGFQVQTFKPTEGKNFSDWAAALNPETNFVLFAEDHPITGEIYPWEEWDKILNDKKIFAIRISHSNHLKDKTVALDKFSVRICAYTPELAVVVAGPRFKAPPLISKEMYWEKSSILKKIEQVKSEFSEDSKAVLAFESALPETFQPFLKSPSRVYDRAVIYSESYNGEAVLSALAERERIVLQSAPFETQMESTCLCRWGGVHRFENWWDPKPSDEVLRGLIVLSAKVIQTKTFAANFKEALKACQI